MQHTAMQKSLSRAFRERPASFGSSRLAAVWNPPFERSCAGADACLASAVRRDCTSSVRASMRALSLIAVPQLLRLVRASASRHRAVSEAICASAWA